MNTRYAIGRFLPRAIWVAVLCAAALAHSICTFHPVSPADPNGLLQLCEGFGCPPGRVSSLTTVYPLSHGATDFWRWQSAVYLAPGEDSPLRDLYTAEIRVTADGRIFDLRHVRNLSMTNDADDDVLSVGWNGRVVSAGRSDTGYSAVSLIDFAGEPASLTADWPALWRLANRINNYQSTGRTRGLHIRGVRLESPAQRLSVRPHNGGFSVQAGDKTISIGADGRIAGGSAQVDEMVRGRPAFLAWAVDTVRTIPWIGRTKIEWLEKMWFDFSDWLARTRYAISGDVEEDVDPVATAEIASRVAKVRRTPGVIVGWPPPAIAPMLSSRKTDDVAEGVWLPMDRDPFVAGINGPPLFYETYVRPDPERPYSRVQITVWDPARVSLHMMAGVREPQSSTGVRGKGEIPRDPKGVDHVANLVGAFNGAFQALHGEWGMVQNREVLLPPRPWGASVVVFEDGRVGMGSWPASEAEMRADILDVRQNIHALLENDQFNPYRREWWGGVPQGIEERVVTTRSGICLTKAGKMMYFWGRHLSPESLAESMKSAGCDFGMHLDMNSGHCGFEYYRVGAVKDIAAKAAGLNKKMEVTEGVPGRKDLAFVARKLVEGMGSMRFPRYINRDPRDFFYLTVKPSVFDNPPAEAASAGWRPLGSTAGFPVAGAMVSIADKIIYKFDPTQIRISVESSEPAEETLLALPYAYSELGQDSDGFVFVSHSADADLLHQLARQSADTLEGLVEVTPGISQWLVIRSAPRAAYERLFKDVKPVPPSVWRESYRQRGKLLAPPEEDTDDTPTGAPVEEQ